MFRFHGFKLCFNLFEFAPLLPAFIERRARDAESFSNLTAE
jgi:hypothetical protein